MNKIEKKIDALIDALGFDAEEVYNDPINPVLVDMGHKSEPDNYKLTKRETKEHKEKGANIFTGMHDFIGGMYEFNADKLEYIRPVTKCAKCGTHLAINAPLDS